jgi:hypothetical protein
MEASPVPAPQARRGRVSPPRAAAGRCQWRAIASADNGGGWTRGTAHEMATGGDGDCGGGEQLGHLGPDRA